MTRLAHNAAILGIPVDTWRLFTGDDPLYEVWLEGLIDLVGKSKREAEKGGGKSK